MIKLGTDTGVYIFLIKSLLQFMKAGFSCHFQFIEFLSNRTFLFPWHLFQLVKQFGKLSFTTDKFQTKSFQLFLTAYFIGMYTGVNFFNLVEHNQIFGGCFEYLPECK